MKPSEGQASSGSDLFSIPVAILLMCAIRSLATNSSLPPLLRSCNDIAEGKRQNKVAHEKNNISFL